MASVYKKVSGICQASPKKIPFVNVSISSKIEENLMEMITDLNTGFWLNVQPSLGISLEIKMKSVYTGIERLCVGGEVHSREKLASCSLPGICLSALKACVPSLSSSLHKVTTPWDRM